VKDKLGGMLRASSGMCVKEVWTVVLVGRPDGKIALGDLGVDWLVILKWILKE
jgi:hypothetical protein